MAAGSSGVKVNLFGAQPVEAIRPGSMVVGLLNLRGQVVTDEEAESVGMSLHHAAYEVELGDDAQVAALARHHFDLAPGGEAVVFQRVRAQLLFAARVLIVVLVVVIDFVGHAFSFSRPGRRDSAAPGRNGK